MFDLRVKRHGPLLRLSALLTRGAALVWELLWVRIVAL